MKAEISIIVPVYNRAHIVERTLDSIAKQTLRPIELILVDNNSSDNSLEVLLQWQHANASPDFHITVLSEPHPGASAARNKGLAEVTTPYVMFFDSDDIMLPDHVRSFVQAFRDNPSLDAVGKDVLTLQLDGSKAIKTFKTSLYQHIFHASFATQRYAAKTELLRLVGGWNENMRGWDDYELGVRLLTAKPLNIKRLKDKPTVHVILQAASITGTDYSSRPHEWELALDTCQSTLEKVALPRRYVRYIELRRAILAGLYKKEHSPHSSRLLAEVLSRESNPIRRAFYRFACAYVAASGRGIAMLAPVILR